MSRIQIGATWKFNDEINYTSFLAGDYDRNMYYIWGKEWYRTKNSENGEWNRDYIWLEKTITEYKGDNLNLMGKLNKAKDSLIGMCD